MMDYLNVELLVSFQIFLMDKINLVRENDINVIHPFHQAVFIVQEH